MSRPTLSTLRPLCAAVALVTAAGLATALPTQAAGTSAEKQRQVRGRVVAPSTLDWTISWAYDVNAKGVGYAVWVDGSSSRRRVLVAKRTPKGAWGKPQFLSGRFPWKGKKGWAGYPDVAVDRKGRATVVWTQPKGPGVRVRVVMSKGKGWTKPRNLSARRDFAGFPDVEVSGNGHAVVHWAGDFPFPQGQFSLMAAYREKDGSWSRPDRLDTSPDHILDERPGSIAIDGRGVATLAWDELGVNGTTGRIQVATRGPQGGWSTETLATGPHGGSPMVATMPDGQMVAAWRDLDGVLVRRRSASGAWGAQEKIVQGPTGIGHNLFGAGISATGRVALLGQEVERNGNHVRPYVLVQDAPGSAWTREYVDESYPQYYLSAFQSDIHVSKRGKVAVTWIRQAKNSSRWFRTFVRVRTNDGRWKPTIRVAKRSNDPALAADGRGRFSVVFGDGGRTSGCCSVLRAARLP